MTKALIKLDPNDSNFEAQKESIMNSYSKTIAEIKEKMSNEKYYIPALKGSWDRLSRYYLMQYRTT
jgi:hypothetical protein